MWPRLKRLTGSVGEKKAVFIAFVVVRQWRKPRWVTAQEPPMPPIENGVGRGWRL